MWKPQRELLAHNYAMKSNVLPKWDAKDKGSRPRLALIPTVWMLVLPLTSCVILSKLPQFPHLKSDNNSYYEGYIKWGLNVSGTKAHSLNMIMRNYQTNPAKYLVWTLHKGQWHEIKKGRFGNYSSLKRTKATWNWMQ